MTDVKSMTMEELKEFMTKIGEKPFRAKQIYAWLHQRLVTSWDEMTNLSKSLREKLSAYPITALDPGRCKNLKNLTEPGKYLFRLEDGNVIESVLMPVSPTEILCAFLLTVGLPYGMQILCIYHRRTDQMPEAVRDAGSDLPYPGRYR